VTTQSRRQIADKTGPRTSRPANEERLHDQLLHELEEHTPEGPGPGRRTFRREIRWLVPILVAGLIGGGAALHWLGGWLAVGIGAVLFFLYALLGAAPAEIGSILRWREHKHFEDVVEHEIEEMEAGGGGEAAGGGREGQR